MLVNTFVVVEIEVNVLIDICFIVTNKNIDEG